jgi:hypothetical protein
LCKQFPEIKLEDKLKKKKGVLSESEIEDGVCNRLGVVGELFEFKQGASKSEAGLSQGMGDDSPIREKAQKQHVELRIKGEALKVLSDDLKRNSAAEDL